MSHGEGRGMKIIWTLRARKRFTSISNYIAREFYPDYADAWEEDVAATIVPLADHPRLGTEAFPGIKRMDLRRILLANKNYWVYYRIGKSAIEILSIRHVLQDIRTPYNL